MSSNSTTSDADFLVVIKYDNVHVLVKGSNLIAKSQFFEAALSENWVATNSGVYISEIKRLF